MSTGGTRGDASCGGSWTQTLWPLPSPAVLDTLSAAIAAPSAPDPAMTKPFRADKSPCQRLPDRPRPALGAARRITASLTTQPSNGAGGNTAIGVLSVLPRHMEPWFAEDFAAASRNALSQGDSDPRRLADGAPIASPATREMPGS